MVAARDLEAMPVAVVPTAPILVVTGEDIVSQAIRRALGELGYRVVTVSADAPARELMAREPFGCVIVDLELPERAGTALVRHCRASQPQAPVIVIGRRRTIREILKYAGSIVAASLQKPFAAPSLSTLVEWVLDRRFRVGTLGPRALRVVN